MAGKPPRSDKLHYVRYSDWVSMLSGEFGDAGRRPPSAPRPGLTDPLIEPLYTPVSLGLFDNSQAERRQRRLAANRALEKHGVRPRSLP